MITIEIDGVAYTGFESATVTSDIAALAGAFEFTATATKGKAFPLKFGARCRVRVDEEPFIYGYIEQISSDHSARGHRVSIRGRDHTGDIVDSSLDGSFNLTGPITLKTVIERVVKYVGLPCNVIDSVGSLAAFTGAEIVAGKAGDNAFDFIAKYCRKRQVLLTTDGRGDIVIRRAKGKVISTKLVNKPGDPNCNILQAQVTFNGTATFQRYFIHAQNNPVAAAVAGGSGTTLTTDQSAQRIKELNTRTASGSKAATVSLLGRSVDSRVRSSRVLNVRSSGSLSPADATQRAKWEQAVRHARAFEYTATVAGHTYAKGKYWNPGDIVRVTDEMANLDQDMMIRDRTFKAHSREGNTTDLKLVAIEAYDLEMQGENFEDKAEAKRAAKKKGGADGAVAAIKKEGDEATAAAEAKRKKDAQK